jgi:hypothetical protein
VICDGQGVPLAVRLTGANRHDSKEALPLVDAIPPLQGERGRPRCRPDCVLGDRAYDAQAIRDGLRARTFTLCWPCVERGTAAAWDAGAGWWNGRLRG